MQENEHESRVIDSLTVDSMKAQSRNPNRVSVFGPDGFVFGVHRDVAAAHGIQIGAVLTRDEIDAAKSADSVHQARDAAMRLLSLRPKTSAQLRKQLIDKGFDSRVVTTVVSDLTRCGYLDDEAFAAEFVQHRIRSRRHGVVRIRRDLARKGVPPDVVERAVSQLEGEVDWRSVTVDEAKKKLISMSANVDPDRRRRRLYDHLARRGFPFDIIRSVMEELDVGRR